jgi:hypothetical protein
LTELFLRIHERCPKCNKPISLAMIEPHITKADIYFHSYCCVACGPVKTVVETVPTRPEQRR